MKTIFIFALVVLVLLAGCGLRKEVVPQEELSQDLEEGMAEQDSLDDLEVYEPEFGLEELESIDF